MTLQEAPKAKSTLRLQFLEMLYGNQEGYICIATSHQDVIEASFRQRFFEWPGDLNKLENYLLSVESTHNVYFCINLLAEPRRIKENCLATDLLWADLDEVTPQYLDDNFPAPPQIVLRSSTKRYQAIWRLTAAVPPYEAQSMSKRLAYAIGADKSGWDLTQLLRMPYTLNQKYNNKPEVQIERAFEPRLKFQVFDEILPQLTDEEDPLLDAAPIPPDDTLPTPESCIYKYSIALNRTQFMTTYTFEPKPEDDWSRMLWKLIHICFEAGMTAEEAFSVCASAPSNKYARDGRPLSHLWKDVVKADLAQKNLTVISVNFRQLAMPQLVAEPHSPTFIDDYREWATEATDAVPQFHDLSSFIMLSAVVSNSVKLNTQYGAMTPNIWGLILGDSTLARKTTAMRTIMDMLNVVNPDLLLATDGSAEGLLTGLSMRPNRVSIFFKDEVSGFFDSINRKEYLAGLPETMTALYDVPGVLSRMLRKETIRIERPAFIFFGGGVKDKVYESLTQQYVLSGFLPRFLIVSGDTDMSRIRATGPANDVGIAKRAALIDKLANIYELYATDVTTTIGGQKIKMPPLITAELDSKTWERYAEIEMLLVHTAHDSSMSDLALPTLDRLSRSLLKMTVILAAARQQPKDDKIKVTMADLDNACWYVQDWGRYSLEVVMNAGKKVNERILDKIVKAVENSPGILRSTIMQHHHLMKRETDEILQTLEDRQLIRAERRGRGVSYYPS